MTKRSADDAMPGYGETDIRKRSCSEAGAMMVTASSNSKKKKKKKIE